MQELIGFTVPVRKMLSISLKETRIFSNLCTLSLSRDIVGSSDVMSSLSVDVSQVHMLIRKNDGRILDSV